MINGTEKFLPSAYLYSPFVNFIQPLFMAGIYIHIPFCRQKCSYCNFFSLASVQRREEFVAALLEEISGRKEYLGDEPVSSVYFGGGTPSLLGQGERDAIFGELYRQFNIQPSAEITMEANPDDISLPWLKALAAGPVNRLSIGVQSFHDDDLAWLERVHDGRQALQSVSLAREAGFTNLTVDLIYGIPGLTTEKWQKNLETFFSLGVPHLSAYSLTVEEKTPLHLQIRNGLKPGVDEAQAVMQFKWLLEEAGKNGFIHYEISNFAREGYYSRHNSLYWTGGHYLGLGPSAHSYNGQSRQWNVASLTKYLADPGSGEQRSEKEVLTKVQRHNEYVMTSLRTIWGCDTAHIRNAFGDAAAERFSREAQKFVNMGFLEDRNGIFCLTDRGKLFADGMAADLFLDGSGGE